jgi:large subunit ribosomal protein L5
MPNLRNRYQEEVAPVLLQEFSFRNVMEVPRIEKVVVNIGMGAETAENSKAIDAAVNDLRIITGQQPVVTRARKSIANFKLREGRAIGVKVTLRGERMWSFLDRLLCPVCEIFVVCPPPVLMDVATGH